MIGITLLAVACAASIPKLRELLRGSDDYVPICEMVSTPGLKPLKFWTPRRRRDGRIIHVFHRSVQRPATKS